jgi:hypothetical protein
MCNLYKFRALDYARSLRQSFDSAQDHNTSLAYALLLPIAFGDGSKATAKQALRTITRLAGN